MDIFLYVIIFLMGIFFGSFYTLAVYRIPKRQDITHTHSYCPNCNHKLGILDLVPVFSYLFLGAKCRYCKQRIRPRYFILEILSGFTFVIFAYLMKLNINALTLHKIIDLGFMILYFTFVVLISGIDKENRKIEKSVNIYGIILSLIYMVYLCIVDNTNIYRYGIYLVLYIIVLIFDNITLKKYAKSNYLTGILLYIITMIIFTGEYVTATAINLTLLAIAIYIVLYKLKNIKNKNRKSEKQIAQDISIGFYLGVSNIIMNMLALLFTNYI